MGGPDLVVEDEEELVEDEEVLVGGMASLEKCKKVTNAEKNDEQGLASN